MLIFWIFLAAVILYYLQRWIYVGLWSRGLKLRLRFEPSALNEGEPVAVVERSENRKWLPLPMLGYRYTLCRNYAPVTGASSINAQVFSRKLALPGRRAATNRTVLESLPRGFYTVADATASAMDLFYTVKREKAVPCSARLTVYPAKIPAERLSLPFRQLLGAVLTRRMAQEDPFQLKGIRPYQIYDSLRTVNWKASAKTGELKVNQFEYSTDEAVSFFLDMGSGSEADREELLRLASSLSQLFLNRGISVSVQTNGRSCITGSAVSVGGGSGYGHQTAIDESLAQLKLTATVTAELEDFLRDCAAAVTARALPVVLSADPTDRALTAFGKIVGEGNGYFISVCGRGEARKRGVTVLSWNPEQEEST